MSLHASPSPLVLAVTLVGFAVGVNPGHAAAQNGPPASPHVILITSDDLHWDTPGIGVESPVGPVMPNVRALADRGVTYSHGYLQGTVCTPSRHAMLSGRYSHRTDTEGFVSISPEIETLPSILHDAGYHTAIINK
ncbi:MAG: sulfatase-like hydrolase/transferase, partial [Planctomycetota bacterium]